MSIDIEHKGVEARLADIEAELRRIGERNERVGADKAWETSATRRMTVASITYLCAAILLRALGNEEYLLNALVPTAGYLLSTLTLPWAKVRWLASRSVEGRTEDR